MQENTGSPIDLDNSADVVVTPQAIMAYKLLRAKAKADTAELEKRAAMSRFRPSQIYPVILYHDGIRWACEYVSGFGTLQEEEGTPFIAYGMFPEEAMQNFDQLWIGVETTSEDEKEGPEDEGI